MKIALNQSEVVAAIRGYVEAQGIDMSGKQLDVTFTSGRKGNGITADLDIYVGDAAPAVGEASLGEAVVTEVAITEATQEDVPADAPEVVEATGSLFG